MIDAKTKDAKPRPGDRVKLGGQHKFAGYTAKYLKDRRFPFGGMRPWVEIERTGDKCFVSEPETQMRKI